MTIIKDAKTTAEDLVVAAEWLDAYEPSDDPGDRAVATALCRVARKLRREADARNLGRVKREVLKTTGRKVSVGKIRSLVDPHSRDGMIEVESREP